MPTGAVRSGGNSSSSGSSSGSSGSSGGSSGSSGGSNGGSSSLSGAGNHGVAASLTFFFGSNSKRKGKLGEIWYLRLFEALCNHESMAPSLPSPSSSSSSSSASSSLPPPALPPSSSLSSSSSSDGVDGYGAGPCPVVNEVKFSPVMQRMEVRMSGGYSFVIEPNNIVALSFAALLEEIAVLSDAGLLKASVLLIRAWCLYEAPNLLGDDAVPADVAAATQLLGASRVLEVMVIWFFASNMAHQRHADEVEGAPAGAADADPFVVLCRFVHTFAAFDWSAWALSCTGLVPVAAGSASADGAAAVAAVTNEQRPPYAPSSDAYDLRVGALIDKYRDRLYVPDKFCSGEELDVADDVDTVGDLGVEDGSSVVGDHDGPGPGHVHGQGQNNHEGDELHREEREKLKFEELPSGHRVGNVCVLDPLVPEKNLCSRCEASSSSALSEAAVLRQFFGKCSDVLRRACQRAAPSLAREAFPSVFSSCAATATDAADRTVEGGLRAMRDLVRADNAALEANLAHAELILCKRVRSSCLFPHHPPPPLLLFALIH